MKKYLLEVREIDRRRTETYGLLAFSVLIILAFLLAMACIDCSAAYGYTGKGVREDAREKYEAFQGKVQEYGMVQGDPDLLREKTPSSEQSQPESPSNGDQGNAQENVQENAQESAVQRPNVYVPDDETQEEDEVGSWDYGCLAVIVCVAAIALIIVFFRLRRRQS